MKKSLNTASVTDIPKWQERNPGFIGSSSLNNEDGYIVMQSNSQRELCKAFTGPLQTDALESFVKGHGNMVLCYLWFC